MALNWSERTVDGRFLGFEVLTPVCHYFFGSAHLSRDEMLLLFPQYEFKSLRQVHGSALVPAQDGWPEADGHWTDKRNVALVIQTADCMPVLFGSPALAIAVHAGWRGVESGILEKAARLALARNAVVEKVLIGPHILAQEFEVGTDVALRLERTHELTRPSQPAILPHEDPGKRRVDLARVARDQLHSVLGRDLAIEVASVSTLSSPLFHSFRRGKTKEAQQYSFIVLR